MLSTDLTIWRHFIPSVSFSSFRLKKVIIGLMLSFLLTVCVAEFVLSLLSNDLWTLSVCFSADVVQICSHWAVTSSPSLTLGQDKRYIWPSWEQSVAVSAVWDTTSKKNLPWNVTESELKDSLIHLIPDNANCFFVLFCFSCSQIVPHHGDL